MKRGPGNPIPTLADSQLGIFSLEKKLAVYNLGDRVVFQTGGFRRHNVRVVISPYEVNHAFSESRHLARILKILMGEIRTPWKIPANMRLYTLIPLPQSEQPYSVSQNSVDVL